MNLKKVLSLVLCVAMMLSVMVVGAGAAFSDQSKIKNTEAVDMCTALNIIGGYPDGTFKPEGNITRAEVTKMICVALNGGEEPAVSTNATPTFNDVRGNANAAWAEGYIESCAAQGIVSGVGGGKFAPNGNVTGTQLAKMLLVALGYKADIQNFTGNAWATNVNVLATQKGLYKDLEKLDVSAALTRDNAAQMIWNALQAKEVKYEYTLVSENGQLTSKITVKDDEKTLMQDKYNAVDYEYGVMTSFEYNSDKSEWTYYFDGTLGASHEHGYTTTADFTSLYGQTVKVIYDKKTNGDVNNVYGMFGKDAVVIAEGVVGDISTLKASDSKVKISGTEYKLEKLDTNNYNVPVYDFSYDTDIDEAEQKDEDNSVGIVGLADDQSQSGFKFVAVDDDNNGKIDFFMVYPFSVAKVSYAGSKNFTLEYQDGSTKTLKFEDVVSYKGLAKDDYVVYTADVNTATNDDTIVKADKVVSGDVTATRGDYKFAVDGTWYEAIEDMNVVSGGSVKNVVVVNGYVFMADGSGSKSVTDYAVVIGTDDGAYASTAKLLFSDGTKKVVDTDISYTPVYDEDDTDTLVSGFKNGALVTYETNSDGEYILTAAKTEATGSGFDTYFGNVSPELKSDKVKYISGADIADDAVIFLHETGDDNYKVITGARLKTTNGTNMTVIAAYADETSSTGYNTVKLAYVSNTTAISSADSLYGYLLSDAASVQNKDKKDVYEVTFLGEDGKEITLKTDDQDKSFETLKEGVVFSYTLNADGDIDGVTILGKTGTKAAAAANKTDAIIAYSGNYITLASDPTTRYEITKDTVILVIDAAGPAAAEGSVTKAYKDVSGKWVNNAIVDLDKTDKEVDLLVIDYQNDIDNVD